MELKFTERFALLNVLPKEGNRTDLIIMKSIIEKIDLTVSEIEKYEIKTHEENGQSFTVWNKEGVSYKIDTQFADVEKKLIIDLFKKLDEDKKMTFSLLDLWDKLEK